MFLCTSFSFCNILSYPSLLGSNFLQSSTSLFIPFYSKINLDSVSYKYFIELTEQRDKDASATTPIKII